jgi:uncharacterized protein (DUF305 family)
MKKFKVLSLVIGLGLAATGCGVATQNNLHAEMNHNGPQTTNRNSAKEEGMDHSKMQSSPNAANAPCDLQFLDTMAMHHMGAVEMAEPAEQKAGHDEIKKLATSIVADQTREIEQMKAWRKEWFGDALPAMNMEMTGMTDSMKGMDMLLLNSLSGNDFDLEFIRQMIRHHTGAIKMAKGALSRSERPEIKKLTEDIIRAQEKEIAEMQRWQSTWKK